MKHTNAYYLVALLVILCAVAFPISAARGKEVPVSEAEVTKEADTTHETAKATPEEAPELKHWDGIPLAAELQDYIVKKCEAVNIRPSVAFAMIYRESTYKADAIGDGGNSFGLMQIQPKWHYERMVKLNCTNLLNPYHNVTVGIDYLAELILRYDGDTAKALVAYNRGSYAGTITEYADAVLSEAQRLETYVLNQQN